MADENTQAVGAAQDATPEKPTTPEATEEEPFDRARAQALIDKLREENKGLKSKAKKAEELEAAEQARKEAEMTEVERLKAELQKYQTELARREREALQSSIAAKVGLPAALAARLSGETPEEMEQDAKAILAEIQKVAKPTAPPVGVTNPGPGATQAETVEQKRERLLGKRADPFAGGGVIYVSKE